MAHLPLRLLVISAIVLPMPLAAQDRASDKLKTPEVVEELFNCRAIANPDERLACFDREVERVFAANETRDLVITDQSEITEAKRGLFGLKLPNLRIFSSGNGSDDVDQLTATLARVSRMDNGRYLFVLEDGARWMQTGDVNGAQRYKEGDEVLIKKASLGSFRASVGGRNAGKVRRLD